MNLSSTPQIWRQIVERKEDSPYAEEQSASLLALISIIVRLFRFLAIYSKRGIFM